MNDGTLKKIINIEVGDILINNNIVKGKIKVVSKGSKMFILNNILVSDSHIVKYNNKWIPVYKHPKAIKYENYNDDYLYCLNTKNKVIQINNSKFTEFTEFTEFTDWDEIYDDKLNKVINNNIIPINSINDIHKYLDCGFTSSTKIELKNGKIVNINKIKPNDILKDGEIVYGIVEIDGLDIVENFIYNLGKNNYIEGYLTNLSVDKKKLLNKNNKLYHLLTDKKTFKIGNYTLSDYNYAIDRFLEI
jgi:hypothetical protein